MTYWQETLRESVTTVDELIKRFGVDHIDQEAVQRSRRRLQSPDHPEMLNLVKEPDGPDLAAVRALAPGERGRRRDRRTRSPRTPIRRCRTSPTATRIASSSAVSPVCAAYCRFCTRRRKVGDPEKIPLGQFDAAFDYIRQHTEVRDVSLSGATR